MQKLIFIAALIFALFVHALCQTSVPTPTPKADEDVVKITTHLIQVDVTVTDKSGKVVHDLKPDDFEIYENGQKQTISNFSFVSGTREITTAQPATDKKTPVVVLPTAPARPEQVHRTIALIVDDLSMSFESI